LQERRQELEPVAPAVARQDIWSTLQSELENMPESLARVAVYYFMDELTHEEIATLVGCSPRKVGNQIAQLAGWSKRSGAA
jgi:RNA polymerase sigma-70 factor (ECF subfamily)